MRHFGFDFRLFPYGEDGFPQVAGSGIERTAAASGEASFGGGFDPRDGEPVRAFDQHRDERAAGL